VLVPDVKAGESHPGARLAVHVRHLPGDRVDEDEAWALGSIDSDKYVVETRANA
jgi:hypothetical protein